jgi:hypothetical protein
MNIEEARKKIIEKGLLSYLLGTTDFHERARMLFSCLPETSSWDTGSIKELFGLLKEDRELQREGVTDVI